MMAGWDNLWGGGQDPTLDFSQPPIPTLPSNPADPRYSMLARVASAAKQTIYDPIVGAASLPGDILTGKTTMADPGAQARAMTMATVFGPSGLRGPMGPRQMTVGAASYPSGMPSGGPGYGPLGHFGVTMDPAWTGGEGLFPQAQYPTVWHGIDDSYAARISSIQQHIDALNRMSTDLSPYAQAFERQTGRPFFDPRTAPPYDPTGHMRETLQSQVDDLNKLRKFNRMTHSGDFI